MEPSMAVRPLSVLSCHSDPPLLSWRPPCAGMTASPHSLRECQKLQNLGKYLGNYSAAFGVQLKSSDPGFIYLFIRCKMIFSLCRVFDLEHGRLSDEHVPWSAAFCLVHLGVFRPASKIHGMLHKTLEYFSEHSYTIEHAVFVMHRHEERSLDFWDKFL